MKRFYLKKILFFLFECIIFSLFCPNCFADSQPKAWNFPHKNLFFVGREDQLQKIHAFFKKDDRRILALTGGPGFGKTQIAKKFAQKFVDDYNLIWWFDSQQDIPSQFEKLATALNILLPVKEQIIPSKMSKEALVYTIKNILEFKQIKYLFIFDNAKEYSQIEKFIPYAHQNFRKNVLLTSRIASLWPDKIEIGKFKREESLQLIKAALPKAKREDMEKLAETLGDYPLCLSIALAFIKSHHTVSINKYLSMYVKNTLKRRERMPGMLLDDYPNGVLAALEISLKYIEEESADSLKALFFMSLLNSKDIPETYIELWLKKTHSSLTAAEAIKHIFDQSLLGISETTEFNVNNNIRRARRHALPLHSRPHSSIDQ